VTARLPTFWYMASKFAGRHKAVFISAVALLVIAVGAAVLVDRQSRIATRRFNSVRKLANFVVFQLNDAVTPMAGSTSVRHLLVNQGLIYLDELSAGSPTDPELRLELAQAYTRLGDVSGLGSEANLGDTAGALKSYTKALALLEPLVRAPSITEDVAAAYSRALQSSSNVEDRPKEAMTYAARLLAFEVALPERLHSQSRLAVAYHTHASASYALGNRQKAMEDERIAAEHWEGLLKERPSNLTLLRDLAISHKNTAARLMDSGANLQETESHLSRAEQLDAQRVRELPGDREALLDWSYDLSQNAFFESNKRHNSTDATSLAEKALAIRTELAKADPQDVRLQNGLRYLNDMLSRIYLDQRNLIKAETHSQRTLQLSRALLAKRDTKVQRIQFANAWEISGKIHDRQGKHTAACRDWAESVHLLENRKLDASNKQEHDELLSLLKACK